MTNDIAADGNPRIVNGTVDIGAYEFGGATTNCTQLGAAWTQVTPAAPWSPRGTPLAVVFGGKMWEVGGSCGDGCYLNDVWSSLDGTNWTEATSAASFPARYSNALIVFNEQMWVLGGANASGNLNDVWSSSDGTNWTQVTAAAPWSGRWGHAAVTFNGQMWVLGGYPSGNDVWSSSDGTNWTQVTAAAPWSARNGHAAVVFNGKMWVLGGGGWSGGNDVWSSSDGTNWTQVTAAAPWITRREFGAVVFNGQMWVLGGWNADTRVLYNDVWSSTDGVNWTEVTAAAPWSVRFGLAVVSFNRQMWLLGGELWSDWPYYNDVWSSGCGCLISPFQITAIARQGNDIRVTWNCVGGHSNVLQSTKAAAIAGYTTNFTDISPVIVLSGVGVSTTNYLDPGVAYAPVLTPPGGTMVTTSVVPSTVSISAADTRGLADSLGGAVPVGSLLMLGAFSISESTIQSNFYAGNVSAIMSAFTPYTNSFAVGDGTGLPASWIVSRNAAGFGGQKMYLLAIDKPTFAAATHLGIYTAPSWVFPDDGNEIDIDLADVTDFVIGAQGGSLTINQGLSNYTFDDTAKLSFLPGRILFYRVRLVP